MPRSGHYSKSLKISIFCLGMVLLPRLAWSTDHNRIDAPHCREADRLMTSFGNSLSDLELSLLSYGGSMSGEIHSFDLALASARPLQIAEGRGLLLQAFRRFIVSVNQDQALRPHLAEYPFPAENIDLRLACVDRLGKWLPNSDVCLVVLDISSSRLTFFSQQDGLLQPISEELVDIDYLIK